MLRKFGTCINPATFGFKTLHDFLDYLGKCGHIKLEFGFIKSVEKGNLQSWVPSDKFFPEDVETKKSSEEKDSKTESARFFFEDGDIKLLSVAAKYYKAFPDQAQAELH